MYFRWPVSYFALKWLKTCIETSQTKLSVMQILSTSMQSSRCRQILQTYKRWHLPCETIFFLLQNVVPWQHWLRIPSFSLNIDILHLLFYSKQIYKNQKQERGKISLILVSDLQRVITQIVGPEHFKKPDVFSHMKVTTGTQQLWKSVHRDLQ